MNFNDKSFLLNKSLFLPLCMGNLTQHSVTKLKSCKQPQSSKKGTHFIDQ